MKSDFNRLSPNTKTIGHSIEWLKQVDSTNRVAALMLSEGKDEGFVIGAETQTAGRGRLGRSWTSQAGQDLTFSIGLTPYIRPQELPIFSIMVPLALTDAIDQVVLPTERIQIKWPNDLVWKGKKWGGILLESKLSGLALENQNKTNAPAQKVPVVIGIGLNVNSTFDKTDFSEVENAVSLQTIAGKPIDRVLLLKNILTSLDNYYLELKDALPEITSVKSAWIQEYKARSSLLGKKITLQMGHQNFSGIAKNLDEQFGLVVELENGIIQIFRAESTTILETGKKS